MITVGETYLSDTYDVINAGTGEPQTGTTVTVEVLLPNGTTDTAPLAEPTPGSYSFAYTTGTAGLHRFSVRATGGFLGSTVLEIGGDVFNVDDAASAVQLVGLREAKEYLNIPRDDVDEDDRLRRTITTASELVERETRLWHRATVTETLPPGRVLVLSSLPVVSIDSITQQGSSGIDETAFQADAYGIVSPVVGAVWPWVGWPNANSVVVTYTAGEEVVPAAVREAVLVTVEYLWSATRGPAALPLAGTTDEEHEPTVTYALPPVAQKILEPWRAAPGIA